MADNNGVNGVQLLPEANAIGGIGGQMSAEEVNFQYERIKREMASAGGRQQQQMFPEAADELMNYLSKQQQQQQQARANSKEMLMYGSGAASKSKLSTRVSYGGQFPLIASGSNTTKARVGFASKVATGFQRSTALSMSIDGSDNDEGDEGAAQAKQDPFTRLNKFKNAIMQKQVTKSAGVKKPRYSIQQDSKLQSATIQGKDQSNQSRLVNQEKRLTGTLEEVNVMDLVNKGKLSQQQQLKPLSQKNLGKIQASFEVNKSIALFKTSVNQENTQNSTIIVGSNLSTQRGPVAPRQLKSILPLGVISSSKENGGDLEGEENSNVAMYSKSVNKKRKKSRKISITQVVGGGGVTQGQREAHSQSMVIADSEQAGLLSSRNPGIISLQNSRDGGPRIQISEPQYIDTSRQSQSTTMQRKIGGLHSMMIKLWSQLFEARNEDLNITKTNQKQLERFIKGIEKNSVRRKLILNEMGFGPKSAPVLSQLIRVGGNIAEWTHVDLSFNKLGSNLSPVVNGLKMNNRIVSLRLSNNELGGPHHIELLKKLIMEHPSLTEIDLSNDESNQNKNKLGNAGLEAIVDGILDSEMSVISMINIAQNNITSQVPETFSLLKALLTMRSEQIISLNLSDNDLGPDFISTLGYAALTNLKELVVSNTRLTNKSLSDLSDYLNVHKFTIINLDLSSNTFTHDSLFKFFNALKNNQSLRRLNLSRADFSFGEQGPPASYFTIFEQFISLNKSLEELNLNDCKLGVDGAAIIGKSLRRNQKLQKLYMSQNRLGDRGIFSILEGVLDNIVTTSQMSGILVVAPIEELDLSKNEIELKNIDARATFCKILSEKMSRVTLLNMRDNLIRDEAAEAISLALKQNLSIMRFQIDMNPIKMVTLKEIELSIKRNIARFKENNAPAIQNKITGLYEERQKVLEDLPFDLQEYQGKTLFETAEHIDRKATVYERANTVYKQQFMEDDRKLDMIREEALRQEKELIKEREGLREERRDADFAEEQIDQRMVRYERQWEKQLMEQEQKVEIVKLAQSKTIDERNKLNKELDKKKENHQLQVDAWNRELAIILREQAVSAMIQESYVKEIDRVKKQQLLMQQAEECKAETADTTLNMTTTTVAKGESASIGHRFGPNLFKRVVTQVVKQNRKSTGAAASSSVNHSTLRRKDSNSSSQLMRDQQARRGSSTIRQPVPLRAGGPSGLQLHKENSNDQQQVVVGMAPPSPSKKIEELQRMKKELRREFRRTEAEVGAIIANANGTLVKKDNFENIMQNNNKKQQHAFRLPNQQNFP